MSTDRSVECRSIYQPYIGSGVHKIHMIHMDVDYEFKFLTAVENIIFALEPRQKIEA